MRMAAIDFGTNSLRLLIAELCKNPDNMCGIKPLHSTTRIVQLGSNLHSGKTIQSEKIALSKSVLDEYKTLIHEHRAQNHVIALATSVFRDTSNGDTVRAELEDYLGYHIQCISGAEEASLLYRGVTCNRPQLHDKTLLCLDIGGGSTEFIIGTNKTILFDKSYPIGCLRTRDQFFHSSPPSKDAVNQLRQHIAAMMSLPNSFQPNTTPVFAFGGTITTIAMIMLKTSNVSESEGASINSEQLRSFLQSVEQSTDNELAARYRPYLDPKRETVLRTGLFILLTIMDTLQIRHITVTNQGILYGSIYSKFESIQNNSNLI